MYDLSHWTKITLTPSLVSTVVNGALSITLLSSQDFLNVPLLLFTIFEGLSALLIISLLSGICFPSLFTTKLIKLIYILNCFLNFASTVVGIYWINSLIFSSHTGASDSLHIRQLHVSLTTIFIISIILKSLTIFFPYISTENEKRHDLEIMMSSNNSNTRVPSVFTDSIKTGQCPSTANSKYSSSIISTLEGENEKVNGPIKNTLNLKLAEMFKINDKSIISQSGELTNQSELGDTTTNSNINVNKNINELLHNISMPNLRSNIGPLISKNLLNTKDMHLLEDLDDISKEFVEELKNENEKTADSIIDSSKFQFSKEENVSPVLNDYHFPNFLNDHEYDEDKRIQLLNISEPVFTNKNIETPLKSTLQNISPEDWKSNNEMFLQNSTMTQIDIPLIDNDQVINLTINDYQNNNVDYHHYEKQNNFLLDELRKEIHENDMQKLKHHESISKMSSSSRGSFSKTTNKKVFTRVLRGSISSSALIPSQVKHRTSLDSLRLTHTKSNSVSTMSTIKTKSHSPLKKFMNYKEPISPLDLNSNISNNDLDSDVNLANSIKLSPKKKSLRLKTPNYRNKKLLSFSSLQDIKTKMGDDNNNNVTKFTNLSTIKNDQRNPLLSDILLPIKSHTQRVFSGTDKSTISNSSVPSGYYGEYDKEKWKIIKKVAQNYSEDNSPIDKSLDDEIYT